VVAWLRRTKDQEQNIIVVANLTPAPRSEYRIGVPEAGFYREILNTDAEWYGGSGAGNQGGVYSSKTACHGFDNDICIHVPPLAVVAFQAVTPDAESSSPTPKKS